MEDQRGQQYNQEHQQGMEHHWTQDDLAAYASANANYYYQMSLWWWNTYMHNLQTRTQPWANQFENHNCECAERSMMVEDGCECCQNNSEHQSKRSQMNLCYDCPDSNLCENPQQSLQGEYSGNIWENNHPLNFKDGRDLNQDDNGDDNRLAGSKGHDDHNDNDNGDDVESEDDDDDDGSDIDMEVDDDFRKFLEQSEKHRQEREQRKQEILQEKDEYIEVGSIHLNTTTRAPSEQPGAKRKAEMQTLYGKHASVIMSLEASLQLNYDKQCDLRQPIFWPSIPLKF